MSEQYDKVLNQLLKGMAKPTPEALYNQLGRLRTEMPAWTELGKPSTSKWLGRIIAVVGAAGSGSLMELVSLRTQFDYVARHGPNESAALIIAQAIDTVIAQIELTLPAEIQGAFIPAGGVFDGFVAVSKVLAHATKQVLLVDPYADDTLISDFVPLAPEGVMVQILGDAAYAKPSLRPAAERWVAQWRDERPLHVRLATERSLHDRLIVTDDSIAWVVGQSFKDLAKRAHSSLVRMDQSSADLKIDAYAQIWKTASPLV